MCRPTSTMRASEMHMPMCPVFGRAVSMAREHGLEDAVSVVMISLPEYEVTIQDECVILERGAGLPQRGDVSCGFVVRIHGRLHGGAESFADCTAAVSDNDGDCADAGPLQQAELAFDNRL